MTDSELSELVTSTSIIHELKIVSCYFKAVVSGIKTFEIRKNSDRGFQKGDVIKLIELEPSRTGLIPTGASAEAIITYVTNYEQKDDYVVFSFALLPLSRVPSGDAKL